MGAEPAGRESCLRAAALEGTKPQIKNARLLKSHTAHVVSLRNQR
jgi:hypothetical protein